MKRKGGFTLVELLVVMAIIAILASIVVPNVIGYIKKSRAIKAHSEIQSIELALTKMLTDGDRNSLKDLFDPAGVATKLGAASGVDRFKLEQKIYTRTLYALLREGRQVLNDGDAGDGNPPVLAGFPYSDVLLESTVKKLGTAYLDLGFDPWGQMYQIYPGPWTSSEYSQQGYPVIFRSQDSPNTEETQLPGSKGGAQEDTLTVTVVDLVTEETFKAGYSAPLEQMAYIWSYGENTFNDQAVNAAGGAVEQAAYANSDEVFFGGGDDVNNWDKNRTWERFYN